MRHRLGAAGRGEARLRPTSWSPWTQRSRLTATARLDVVRTIGLRAVLRQRHANRRHAVALAEKTARVVEEIWREAAAEVGAEFRALTDTLIEFRLGSATAHVSAQRTPFADPVSSELADDKPLAYRLLSDAGLPVPARAVVAARDRKGAARFAAGIGTPLVVKPVRGLGGEGVVGEIHTVPQLERAIVHAGRICPQVLIEQQAPGDSYRILLLEGDVLDVLRRPRPTITGDGRSTIANLLLREYDLRIATQGSGGLKPFSIDLDCLLNLEQSGFDAESVLRAGETIVVRTATNYNSPDQTETLPRPYPESLVGPARQAAATLGARLAGVDIVTSDPTRPLEETGGVVLEVNAVPGLVHHYNLADSKTATRVAVPILRKLLGEGDAAHVPAQAPAG